MSSSLLSSTLSAITGALLACPGTALACGGALSLLWVWRRSLPFAWTLRILFSAHTARYRSSSSLRFFLSPPRTVRRSAEEDERTTLAPPYLLLSALPPPGTCIFDERHTSQHKASIDECDFNMHLSNSSYPKNMDYARTEFAARCYAVGMHSEPRDRVWFALGGTSFRFVKEIPMGREYGVRCRIETWDEKWVYVVGEFITTPRSSKKSKSKSGAAPTETETLHCIALARLCVKSNRKTIPPWLFLALCGYAPAGSGAPTQNWERAEALRRRFAVEGKGGRQVGVLERYVPASAREGSAEREEWMERTYWDVEGWEEERKKRLEGVKKWSLLGE